MELKPLHWLTSFAKEKHHSRSVLCCWIFIFGPDISPPCSLIRLENTYYRSVSFAAFNLEVKYQTIFKGIWQTSSPHRFFSCLSPNISDTGLGKWSLWEGLDWSEVQCHGLSPIKEERV